MTPRKRLLLIAALLLLAVAVSFLSLHYGGH